MSRSETFDRFQNRILGYDLWLMLAPVVTSLIGVVMVYTAAQGSMHYASRQLMFTVLGVVVMATLATIDYRRLERVATPIYVVTLLALFGVMIPGIGSSQYGASRWYNLGFIQIQPSEFAVLAVILAFATYVARRPDGLTWRDISRVLLMSGLPMGLIFMQPDFGTAAVLVIVIFALMVGAGVPMRVVVGLIVGTAGAVVVAFNIGVVKHYQIVRITAFLHPNSNVQELINANYNVLQAKNAIGAGGLFGAGIGHGAQTSLGYVPFQLTDFVFSAIGEQLGFIGSIAMLVLLFSIAWRVLVVALSSRDTLGRMLCVGIFAFIAFSVFQNAGMAMGIMPVAGIPLPFVSYGGSAMLCFYATCGVALSVSRKRGR